MKLKKRIVLAYSGGLDTSIILKWLQENYNAEVICYTADIGQKINREKIFKTAKKFGVKKCIARISNSELLHRKDTFDLTSIGIDEVIYPEALGANEIKTLLKESAATDSLEFEGGKLHLMGIMIDKDSLLKDKTLGESTYLNPDTNYTPVAIVRDIEDEIHNETIIPRSHNILKEGDTAYFIAESKDGVEKVLSLAGKKNLEIKNIMIFGGSPLAYMTAKYLSKNIILK